jgi:hypothetical protein
MLLGVDEDTLFPPEVLAAAVSVLLVEIGGKSDGSALRRRWVHQLADSRKDGLDGIVVVLVFALELIELAGERGVGGEQFPQPHEGAYDVEAHLDRAGAAEDRGGHDGAMLGEGVRWKARIAMLLVTGRKDSVNRVVPRRV